MLRKIGQTFSLSAIASRGISGSICAVLFAASINASASNEQVKLSETRYIGNWAVGCDNGLRCEAVALMPPDSSSGTLSMVISRSAGKDSVLTINIFNFDSESDRYRLLIDGKLIDSGPITDGAEPISVTGKKALKLARAAVKGNEIQVVDASNKELGRVSLTGSAGALRYIDAQQGRAGSRDALAASGRRSKKPLTAALPVISAKKIVPSEFLPETTDLVALVESSKCNNEGSGVTKDATYSLGNNAGQPQALALLSCGGGAYNFATIAYVGTRDMAGKWQFEPAKFDYHGGVVTDEGNYKIIMNSAWDAASQIMTSYQKGRGPGDCGSSADYVWDGEMFRLIHARQMKECRGSLDWITVWRAKVEFNG
jgi:hypothetical protein